MILVSENLPGKRVKSNNLPATQREERLIEREGGRYDRIPLKGELNKREKDWSSTEAGTCSSSCLTKVFICIKRTVA